MLTETPKDGSYGKFLPAAIAFLFFFFVLLEGSFSSSPNSTKQEIRTVDYTIAVQLESGKQQTAGIVALKVGPDGSPEKIRRITLTSPQGKMIIIK